jgi:hypothetical protein
MNLDKELSQPTTQEEGILVDKKPITAKEALVMGILSNEEIDFFNMNIFPMVIAGKF